MGWSLVTDREFDNALRPRFSAALDFRKTFDLKLTPLLSKHSSIEVVLMRLASLSILHILTGAGLSAAQSLSHQSVVIAASTVFDGRGKSFTTRVV